jgi:Gpi18-like mannosyltransferase
VLTRPPASEARAAWRLCLPPFVAGKAIGLLVPVLWVWHQSQSPGFPTWGEIREAFLHWDAAHYLNIAANGYPSQVEFLNGFWFGYPLLIHVVSFVVRDDLVAGLLISTVAELIALWYIARLILYERDTDAAHFTVWAVALYPLAIFLSAVYTDASFLAASAACLYYARIGDHVRACTAGFAATFVRINGVLLIIPVVIEYLRRRRWRPGPGIVLPAAVLLPAIGFGLYTRAKVGDFFAYQHGLEFNNYHNAFPWEGAQKTIEQVVLTGVPASTSFNFAPEMLFGIGGFLLVVAALLDRRFPVSLALYCAATWVLITSRSYWLGLPRYSVFMFPLAILIADGLRQRASWQQALLATSGGVSALAAAIYASGYFVG